MSEELHKLQFTFSVHCYLWLLVFYKNMAFRLLFKNVSLIFPVTKPGCQILLPCIHNCQKSVRYYK